MQNAGLNESQAGIKIAGRNINNLRYSDDTTLMAETEEELEACIEIKTASFAWGFALIITADCSDIFNPIYVQDCQEKYQ